MNDAPIPPSSPTPPDEAPRTGRERVLGAIILALLALGSAFFLKSAYLDLRYDPRNQNVELLRRALFPNTP